MNNILYGGIEYDKIPLSKKIQNWLIPSNIRFLYDKISGNDRLHTEDDLTQSDIKALRQAYKNSQDKQRLAQELINDFRTQGVDIGVDSREWNRLLYDDYDKSYWDKKKVYNVAPLPQEEKKLGNIIDATFRSPGYRMATTLGKADYFTDENGNVIVADKYQFNPKYYNPTKNRIYGWIRNDIAPNYGEDFDVRINLGNPLNW